MPLTSSAIKKARVDRKRTALNREWKEKIKQAVKKARLQATAENLSAAASIVDKAAKKHLINKRHAVRVKSRLAKHPLGKTESQPKKSVKKKRSSPKKS